MPAAEPRDGRQRGEGQRRAGHDAGGTAVECRHSPGTVDDTDALITATSSTDFVRYTRRRSHEGAVVTTGATAAEKLRGPRFSPNTATGHRPG